MTSSSLEKTARSFDGNNRPALTTTNILFSTIVAHKKVVIAQTRLLIAFYKCGKWVYFWHSELGRILRLEACKPDARELRLWNQDWGLKCKLATKGLRLWN